MNPQLRSNNWRLTIAVIGAIVLWRVLIAALMPVTQDEAYYFDWARALAWGYFDHPPGVALLGLGGLLAPGEALAARAGGLIAGALTLLVLARLYRNSGLIESKDMLLALMLASATLPALAGGVLTTPDSVLALAWALALHESERALAGQRRRWLSTGLAVGLGLLGKYIMLLIGPVLLWAILWADPKALRTRWPYLGGLLALLVFAPNLLWNAQHDWLSLRFQFGHGFATELGALNDARLGGVEHTGPESLSERAGSVLSYLAIQLGFWGALAVPLVVALRRPAAQCRGLGGAADSAHEIDARATTREPSPISHQRREGAGAPAASFDDRSRAILAPQARALLIAATLFPLGFFALLSSFSAVEANWPIMYLFSAAPLVALWLRHLRPWVLTAAGLNLLLVSLYALHAATAALPLPDSANRVLRETHGFAELAEYVAALDAPVYADRYQTTAMLRFYRPDLAISQWPGLSRPSEYLRGQIAPRVDPSAIESPVWLIARSARPPQLKDFTLTERRTLFDDLDQGLQTRQPISSQPPLHVWRLYRFAPNAAAPASVAATDH